MGDCTEVERALLIPRQLNMFMVMRIVGDEHDCSFVEKVELLQHEILGLCNKLVPKSASVYHRIRIDFDGLNERCLPVVGFYGDKKMMTRIFRQQRLIDDESVLAKMEGGRFEPGLYVIVNEEDAILAVFYWHEGEHFRKASKKDVSCNFIRYLVELCDCVCICVEGNYSFENLAASTVTKLPVIDGSCPYLAYIYHIFDKFGTIPALFAQDERVVIFKVVFESSRGEACIKYMEELVRQLSEGKGKDFSNLKIHFEVNNLYKWETRFDYLASVPRDMILKKMGLWLGKLMCLLPIQICRPQNNGVVVFKDGLQIRPHISCADRLSLAKSVSFGFYDSILHSWKGKIRVISTMGEQSSGKYYLLNHLSGSLLDVVGGRCSDGVWMTITTGKKGDGSNNRHLFVLLVFEGLGSCKRTKQEDTLLSVLNAAVSNLTIFNKKSFDLDKDTESVFSRFQRGINFLKHDKKLFKGFFCIAIKNMDGSDVEGLIQKFHLKISQIWGGSEGFISKMYDGNLTIVGMHPFYRSAYHKESLRELAETANEGISFYDNGVSFLTNLKLIIAQTAAKDWSPVDGKHVAFIVSNVRRNLMAAVSMGCISAASNKEVELLVEFDTQEAIPDYPLHFCGFSLNVLDSGLCLLSSKESPISVSRKDALSQLKLRLELILPRKGSNGESWHSMFEKFLELVAERRCDRVRKWIRSNTVDFCDYEEVQNLQLEADEALAAMKQGISVCGCRCSVCFYRCVLEKGHNQSDSEHSCMGSHSCTENCSYCARVEGEADDFRFLTMCRNLAGHQGSHDCRSLNHRCGSTCTFSEMLSHCNQLSYSVLNMHNSPQHICKMTCSTSHPSGNDSCAVAVESNHGTNQCHGKFNQTKCSIDGVPNHFDDPNAEHLYKNIHVLQAISSERALGLDRVIEDMEKATLQSAECDHNVKILGIVGIEGCGKTSLAKELYDRNRPFFALSSFLFDVGHTSAINGLHGLQKKLLQDLLGDVHFKEFDDKIEGKKILAECLRDFRVLIVLDGVDDEGQINALLPEKEGLRSGSYIVVTARNRSPLMLSGITSIYEMTGLNEFHSKRLLCWHAFKQPYPKQGFGDLIEIFSRACHGLPLALEGLGKHLYSRCKDYWETHMQNISDLLVTDTEQPLRFLEIKGDDLNDNTSNLTTDLVWLRWYDCPYARIPLWISLESLRVLDLINGVFSDLWSQNQPTQLRKLSILGSIAKFPKSIRQLQFLETIVVDGCLNTKLKSISEEFCRLKSLKHLTLRWCRTLTSLPNHFGDLTNLQHLDLGFCSELKKLPHSFKELIQFQYLNFEGCYNLELLPSFLGKLETLQYLNFKDCRQLKVLPHQVPWQVPLKSLNLVGTSLKELPNEVGRLVNLEILEIGSPYLNALPLSMGNMTNLQTLNLEGCTSLVYLPISLRNLKNLSKTILPPTL